MVISKITARNYRDSSNNSTKHDGKIEHNCTIEINSQADTLIFGKNFQIVSSI